MSNRWQRYRQGAEPLPREILSWPFRGGGLACLGVEGRPVREPMPTCGPDQVLVRVDAVGLCPSDAKMVRMGNDYPLFFDRNFAQEPTRLGHEVSLTVIQVGEQWQEDYYPGQRLGLQPDVYVDGERVIFGVNIPGGMTQYVPLGRQVLAGDDGSYAFPVPPETSYVEVALLEPWACVDVAFIPRRRLEPLPGGVMWIKGRPGDSQTYRMSRALDSARVILTDVPPDFAAWVRTQPVEVVERNDAEGAGLAAELTGGRGFDDIILLDPGRAETVATASESMATKGTLTIVSPRSLDGPVSIDVSRLHYEFLSFMGCPGPDIAEAFGPQHNRSEMRPGGVALIAGAGGPMGRMQTQRALEMPEGPAVVIVTNRGEERLASLVESFGPLAEARGRRLAALSPRAEPGRLEREVARLTGGRGCDDIVCVASSLTLIEEVVPYLAPDGMLVLFAGLPEDSRAALPLDHVYLHQAQITGASGSTVPDQLQVLDKIKSGALSPARSLAAVAGLKALKAGLRAVMEQEYAGKVVVFPQLLDLPLLSLAELETALPEVYAHLGPDQMWTARAEQALFERFLPA